MGTDLGQAEATSYVGRTVELATALRMLETNRLVTLTGPGGVGKTRLCGRVLAHARGRFADGAVFVGLAEVRDADLLGNALAYRLGLVDLSTRAATQTVVDHLRDRELLLVLDNCEHLLTAVAAFLTEVMRRCPGVVVLATSRQSLGVAGERLLPVPPLEVPEEDAAPPEALARYAAVELFRDRAEAVLPTFAVDEHNSRDLVRICRKLDGLPLAIELAAVRVRVLSPSQIVHRLDHRLSLLTSGARTGPERQQTLRATIDWSYELCSETERLVWARASVFAGGFDLAAAEQVCGGNGVDPADVLDVLDGLIDKSILTRAESDGEVRFGMLEALREYGQDVLEAAGDRLRVARLHRDWCYALTLDFLSRWIGPDQVALVARLRREHANLRVALEFCFAEGEPRIAVHMISCLDVYWPIRGGFNEARFWAERALAALPADAPERLPAMLLQCLCVVYQGEVALVRAQLAAHEDLRAAVANPVFDGYFALAKGIVQMLDHHEVHAVDLFAQAMTTFRESSYLPGAFYATIAHGMTTGHVGDYETSRKLLREAIADSERIGEVYWRGNGLCFLAYAEAMDGNGAAVAEPARAALRLQQDVRDHFGEATAVSALIAAEIHDGDFAAAARLLGVSDALWEALAMDPMRTGRFGLLRRSFIEAVDAALPPARSKSLIAEGRTMPKADWLPYALGERTTDEPSNPLTPRETQIAELLSEGLRNRDIANRLVISTRTVESHVDHIRAKLGLHSRTQIVAWLNTHRTDEHSADRKPPPA
ncbi:LuxR C-terminal-related transcriptional regulator [Actinokineospora soli]|uniref:LuxR C-terminal-related transcriptional regulator n=1 Tax=Actinokineospora soli TaxID=1048753 RepID=A0ABW2TMR9_9PSEU